MNNRGFVKMVIGRNHVEVMEMEHMNTKKGNNAGSKKEKRTVSKEDKENNYLNAQKRKGKYIRKLIDINFMDMQSSFVTLTFGEQPATVEQCNLKLYNLIRGLKKRYNGLWYLAVLEMDAKGRLHYHVILNAICTKELEQDINKLWKHGFEKMVEPVTDVGGLSWYITKQMVSETNYLFGHKRYLYSKELLKPETVKSWDDKDGLFRLCQQLVEKEEPVSQYEKEQEFAGKTTYTTYNTDIGFYGDPKVAVRK